MTPNIDFEIFHEPKEPEIFQVPPVVGSGSESVDNFIAARVGLMSDDPDTVRALQVAQDNIRTLDHVALRDYIGAVASEGFRNLEIKAIDRFAETGDIEGGAAAVQQIRQEADQPDALRQLAAAAAQDLDQFEDFSVHKAVARRNAAMVLFAKKMEELGITPDTFFEKFTGILGTMVPGRQVYQHLTSGEFDLFDKIRALHTLPDKEFFEQLPDVMTQVAEMSGNNPFIFMERMEAFLDPDDIASLKTFLALDTFDITTLVAGLPKLAKLVKLSHATNTPIKFLRDTGKVNKAAELNVAAMGDDAAASAVQIDRVDAVQNASPFGGEGLDPNLTNGLAASTQAIIAERYAQVEGLVRPLHDQGFLLRRQDFTPSERAAYQEKYLSQFAGEAKIVDQGEDWFDVEVAIQRPSIWPKKARIEAELLELRDTKKAYKLALKKADESTGQKKYIKEMIDQTRDQINRYEMILERIAHRSDDAPTPMDIEKIRVKYTQDAFGNLVATQYKNSSRWINSPSTNVEQLMPGIVEAATSVDYQTNRIVSVLMNARNAALKGVSKKRREALDSILLQGDKDRVIYDASTLAAGVRTPDGLVKLESAEELAAYYSVRDLYDNLWQLKNVEMRRSLELGNFKTVFIKGEEETINFVNVTRPASMEERASIRRIYNDETGAVENVADIDLERVANAEIYKLKYPYEAGEELVNYIVIKPNRIKELPRYVLSKRDGYVPKINKNIFWVAEMIGDKMIDGTVVRNFSTVVRYFDNPIDADTWKAAQLAKGQTVEIRTGKEWIDSQPGHKEEFEAQIFGGLYGGKRALKDVPFGLEGTPAERMGGIEAMEAYMNHIASRMPAVNFRAGLIQRFLNSARNPVTKESYLENPGDWQSPIKRELRNKDDKTYSGLAAYQMWVKDQIRIPTTEERLWDSLSVKLARATAEVPGLGRKLSKWSMQIASKDRGTQLRGLAFHATLGWFNPSQLFVQAMGATLAASIKPHMAPIYMWKSLALRAAMFAKSDDAVRAIGKSALLDQEEFLKMVRAYQRTGLHESTLSTGDFAALQGLPHGMDNFRWAANKGLIFFKEGERFARNFAWISAYDDVLKGRKLPKITDDIIDEITNRHFRYTLNLNRANRALWQKGVLSIPTQFWQISSKFIENMLPNMLIKSPNGWTGKEKALILGGQIALFGAAGLPYGRTLVENLINYAQSDDEYGLAIKDPQVLTWLQGGLTELMMYRWTGERFDVTNRLSIPAGIEQMIEIMTSDHKTGWDILFGVTGEIGNRTWDAIKMNGIILGSVITEPENLDSGVALEVLNEVGSIVSTWRNIRKALTWDRLGFATDRMGNRIIPINDTDNHATILAQAMGIAPKALDDYHVIKNFNKATEQDYRDATVSVLAISYRYMKDPEMLTDKKKQGRMRAMIALVLSSFSERERLIILERVNKKLQEDNYKLPEEMEKALDNMYNKEGASDLQLNATMVEP